MQRVVGYIDGFNLYFGLREKGWRRYYWLNPAALINALTRHDQQFIHCHYFTARFRSDQGNQGEKRQALWLDALGTIPEITCHFGHFLSKTDTCRRCGAKRTTYEEKMTDVNIATRLLIDAYDDRFDTAIIVSADSDLSTPIEKVREKFPNKRVIVAFPPRRHSAQLTRVASGHVIIRQNTLRNILLPDEIKTAAGHVLKRPDGWR